MERSPGFTGRRWAEVSISIKLAVLSQYMYIGGKQEFWFEQHRLACNRQGLCLTGSAFLLMQKWSTRGWDSLYGYLQCGWTDHPGLPLWSLEKKIKTSPASPGLLHVNCPGYLTKNMYQALLPEHLWGQFRWGQMVHSIFWDVFEPGDSACILEVSILC